MDEKMRTETFIGIAEDDVMNASLVLIGLGYAVRTGTEIDTLPADRFGMPGGPPVPQGDDIVLAFAKIVDNNRPPGAVFDYIAPLRDAGIEYRFLMHQGGPPHLRTGQLRRRDTNESVMGRLWVGDRGIETESWRFILESFGLSTDDIYFDPDPDLPEH